MHASIKVQVHEGEPGMTVVMFVAPPEENSQRSDFLHRALSDWLRSHPELRIQDVRPLRHLDRLYGLAVYWGSQTESATPLKVKIEPRLFEEFGREYIEAVAVDAATLACDKRVTQDFVVMVNRRELALIVDRDAWRVTIIRLEEFGPRLSDKQREEIDDWLAEGEIGYFVFPLIK